MLSSDIIETSLKTFTLTHATNVDSKPLSSYLTRNIGIPYPTVNPFKNDTTDLFTFRLSKSIFTAAMEIMYFKYTV